MFQGLVDSDDTGDKISGTPHDNAWLQRFNNAINARWSITTISATGTVNDLDIGEADVVQLTNASALTITGFLAPSAPTKIGKRLQLIMFGSAPVLLAHQNAASASPNRLFNLVQSAPTPINGGGSAEFIYNGGAWVLVAHEQGTWLTAPYNAANFTNNGGSWVVEAGDVQRLAYRLSGRTLTVKFTLVGTSLSGALGNTLSIQPPAYGGFAPASGVDYEALAYLNSPGVTVQTGYAQSGGAIQIISSLTAAFSPSTNATYIIGGLTFQVI